MQSNGCPHCSAGSEGSVLSLVWAHDERCWRCIVCGFRAYEQYPRATSEAERLWDRMLDQLDEEESTGMSPWISFDL